MTNRRLQKLVMVVATVLSVSMAAHAAHGHAASAGSTDCVVCHTTVHPASTPASFDQPRAIFVAVPKPAAFLPRVHQLPLADSPRGPPVL